jgi:hypothetical protein
MQRLSRSISDSHKKLFKNKKEWRVCKFILFTLSKYKIDFFM